MLDGGVGVVVVVVVVAAAIFALASLCSEFEPLWFPAITLTRMVLPTSLLWSVYAFLVCPAMFLQFAPEESQESHWYWKLIGAEPFHVPGLAVNVWPTVAVPLIDGGVEFVGATDSSEVAPNVRPTTTRETAAAAVRMKRRLRGLRCSGVCFTAEPPPLSR